MKKAIKVSFYFYIVMLIVSLILYTFIPDVKGKNVNTLLECFESTGAKLAKSEIYCNVNLDGRCVNKDGIKSIVQDYAKAMDIDMNEMTKSQSINGTTDIIKYEGALQGNKHLEIKIEIDRYNNSQGYMSIMIAQDSGAEQQEKYKTILTDISNEKGLENNINMCIIGYFNGEIENDQINKVYGELLYKANAKTVTCIKDNGLISATAYSANIGDYRKVGGKKVNLNFAARYNSCEKRTYIWVANPVIITEY